MQLVKDAIVDVWHRVWDQGNVDALDDLYHPQYRRESASSGRITTLDDLKRDIGEVRAAFPDLTTTLDRVIVDGDEGALFWNSSGTFLRDIGDVPATGRVFKTRGSNQLRIQDGRIVYEKVTWDRTELLSDIGVPSLGSAFEDAAEETELEEPAEDPQVEILKGFNRQFVTGVTVVTTTDEHGAPRGLAVNSYASVSLDPPLVLVCIQKTSSTYGALFRSTHLGINIMSNQQFDLVRRFAGKSPDKFAGVEWEPGPHGSPLLTRSSATIEAEIKERFQARTHTVFIGRVNHATASDIPPIIYRAGQFFDGAELSALSG